MKKILSLLLAVFGLNTACSQNFEDYDVKEFAELIADSNVVILDVRKADEFADGHIKGAILIDQFQSDFVEQAKAKLPKDKTIAIYCRSGRRSANAAGKLADVGYKCVNLKGGILAWKEANMPVVFTKTQSVYDFTVKDEAGKDVSLADYKGKVLLIVNTATRCGFTPQYKELEALYEKYAKDGFEILDFPCNQFGEQAPGTIQEIHQFCTANFDIQFPQFDKIDVNGANEHPLYTYLKAQKGFGGFDTKDQRGKFMDDMLRKRDADFDKKSDIKWNFTKFLISRDGRVLKRYEPTDQMSCIEADLLMELNHR